MRINNNIPALFAYTSLSRTDRKIAQATQRLSSGIRINSVKDDAAGMAISNKLKTQVGGITQASRNAWDGISLLQTAEGTLQEVHNMLARIHELSVQASNGTNQTSDRIKMNDEIASLLNEIDDISYKTEFNNIKVLNGDASRLAEVPNANKGMVNVIYTSDTVPIGDLTYKVDAIGLPANVISGAPNLTNLSSLVGKSVQINDQTISISQNETPASLATKLQEACNIANLNTKMLNNKTWSDWQSGSATFMLYTKEAGQDQSIHISGDAGVLSALGLSATQTKGIDSKISAPTLNGVALNASSSGSWVELTGNEGQKIKLELTYSEPDADGKFFTTPAQGSPEEINKTNGSSNTFANGTDKNIVLKDFGQLVFHIGANKDMDMSVQIPNLSIHAMGIEYLNVKTFEAAQKAIGLATQASSFISDVRSKLGAYQNRLEHTILSLDTTNDATAEALSRIYDTDMALEMTQLTQHNIISQAGMSIMAQANQRPQQILQLLN